MLIGDHETHIGVGCMAALVLRIGQGLSARVGVMSSHQHNETEMSASAAELCGMKTNTIMDQHSHLR